MENYQVQPQAYTQTAQNLPAATNPIGAGQAQGTQATSPVASGVNIQIYNPSANTGNPMQSGLPGAYPSNYYLQQPVYNMYPSNAYQQQPLATQPIQQTEPQAAAPVSGNKETDKTDNDKKTGKTKKVVELTDDYIKTLESYLRSQDKEIRMMGAKELAKRFSEDDSRRGDRALNALLNLTLQDPSSSVKSIGLAIAEGGKAQGDENTVKILQNMQKSDTGFGQDALSASNALLQMSGNTVEIPDNSPDKPEKKEKDESKE